MSSKICPSCKKGLNPDARFCVYCGFPLLGEETVESVAGGRTEPFVQLGNLKWQILGLRITCYRNGDQIPVVQDPDEWSRLTAGAMCYYDNHSVNAETFGILYNWYAVNDPRGLAPEGWHVPGETDWSVLDRFLGGYNQKGYTERTHSFIYLTLKNKPTKSGYLFIPAGYRDARGKFFSVLQAGFWWSSSESSDQNAVYRAQFGASAKVLKAKCNKKHGLSVICVKDKL